MWINVLVTSLFSALAVWLPNIVARVITAAGFGYVTYNLGTYGFDSIFNLFKGYILQLDSDLLILLSLAKIDDAIGIIFGGFVASTTLKMTTIHTIRQFRPITKIE